MCKTDDFCVLAEPFEDGAGNIGLKFKNKKGETLQEFHCVTSSKVWAREFCDRCNSAGLSEVHILDVIEDAL